MKIRIKFRKYENMKFIGHLDVMRYFQKAIRRSEVDIRYSEGFSPHQIMSFAAPLGVGITSNSEYVDIEVLSTGSSAEMVERLNETMTEGFEVASWRLLPDSAGNAMSIVAAADYTVAFRPGYEPEMGAEQWFSNIIRFFEQPRILVTKKTKKGEAQVDLKPLIYDMKPCCLKTEEETGRAVVTEEEGCPALFMRISTGSSSNVKPDMVLDAYYASIGEERPLFAYMVQREEVYADMSAEKEQGDHKFVALEELGQEIDHG
ncbi:TIGR03936 family radical SAM-associated protein [Lacrimispora sp. 210928-DFI.3.58]|uniref:TIGR03936 family radical SAM-associated protein n=1 Tax=Lacrimispora sp. 210928-DFI.3.58 TaxID=2883214 RepID=UPI001D0964E5|nr:TIGR03936 family radical SAM-associated protein [Lacrimispora sp. 210928-DFI.3.58]MCB7320695.1 TIGR03936 family radical SAM-associated protein [Lacrimispora sp. 210928-DFI.3.58]